MSKRKTPKKIFSDAFRHSCELLAIEERDARRETKAEKATKTKRATFLSNEITPASKRASITRSKSLVDAAQEIMRRDGPPENIAQFIRKLEPHLSTRDSSGKTRTRTERSARNVLRSKLGLQGKPGRKAKRKNP